MHREAAGCLLSRPAYGSQEVRTPSKYLGVLKPVCEAWKRVQVSRKGVGPGMRLSVRGTDIDRSTYIDTHFEALSGELDEDFEVASVSARQDAANEPSTAGNSEGLSNYR